MSTKHTVKAEFEIKWQSDHWVVSADDLVVNGRIIKAGKLGTLRVKNVPGYGRSTITVSVFESGADAPQGYKTAALNTVTKAVSVLRGSHAECQTRSLRE